MQIIRILKNMELETTEVVEDNQQERQHVELRQVLLQKKSWKKKSVKNIKLLVLSRKLEF